jgi:hypothetical protein
MKVIRIIVINYKRFNMEKSITRAMNYNYRITATLYTLEVWFVSHT